MVWLGEGEMDAVVSPVDHKAELEFEAVELNEKFSGKFNIQDGNSDISAPTFVPLSPVPIHGEELCKLKLLF